MTATTILCMRVGSIFIVWNNYSLISTTHQLLGESLDHTSQSEANEAIITLMDNTGSIVLLKNIYNKSYLNFN